ncbi:Hypothetical_protein [Hexamita inflata]|uniref:Hypothetical_protein n=1 Tax=Hexamita inflata TaxID=28002 RepID=A0AA86UT57_9EUKA|nr:Hypothetical protein HINF_LOCUS51316 [Hexamita inflata]
MFSKYPDTPSFVNVFKWKYASVHSAINLPLFSKIYAQTVSDIRLLNIQFRVLILQQITSCILSNATIESMHTINLSSVTPYGQHTRSDVSRQNHLKQRIMKPQRS